MLKIAIFASGTGSNAIQITDHFRDHAEIEVVLLVTNNPKAPVIKEAKERNLEVYQVSRNKFYKSGECLEYLKGKGIDFVVLAGFMWLIPENLVQAYSNRMVNIHPALLPAFGGKGMYGMHVHRAVIADGSKESGITIHYVNEEYDRGEHIFQAKCLVSPQDTPESLAKKVQKLEHAYYPAVVEGVLLKKVQ